MPSAAGDNEVSVSREWLRVARHVDVDGGCWWWCGGADRRRSGMLREAAEEYAPKEYAARTLPRFEGRVHFGRIYILRQGQWLTKSQSATSESLK